MIIETFKGKQMRRYPAVCLLIILAGCASKPAPAPEPTPAELRQQQDAAAEAIKAMMLQFKGDVPMQAVQYPESQYGRYVSLLNPMDRDFMALQARRLALEQKQRDLGPFHVNSLQVFADESSRAEWTKKLQIMRGLLQDDVQLLHDVVDRVQVEVNGSTLPADEKSKFLQGFNRRAAPDLERLDATSKLGLQLLDIYDDMFRIATADKPRWVASKLQFNSHDAHMQFQADVDKIKPIADEMKTLKTLVPPVAG